MSKHSVVSVAAVSMSLAVILNAVVALDAFAGEYREADVQAAVKALASKDQYERKSAAFKLTEMGTAAATAVPTLIEIVQTDETMTVRGEAAKALGNIGAAAEPAVPALIAFLQSEEGGYERTYAASALGGIGKKPEQAVPALINALQHDQEPVVRELAARALGDFGAQAGDAIPALVEAIRTGDKDLRTAAASGLAKIPARAADVPILIALLGDEIDSARLAAAKSLGGLGAHASDAVPALSKLLSDKDAGVRAAAADALGAIGPTAKDALPDLKNALKDAETHDRAEAALKLIKSSH